MADVWPEVRQEDDAYRRIELITGRRRCQAWSGEQKARILAESAEPGANISEVARRNGVNRGLLTTWRRMVGLGSQAGAAPKAGGDGPLFVPVMLGSGTQESAVAGTGEAGRIEVELRAGRVVLTGALDPHLAAAVIAAVRGR